MTIKKWEDRLLECDEGHITTGNDVQSAMLAEIKEMRAAIDAWEKQEPTAWLAADQYGNIGLSLKKDIALIVCEAGSVAEPLYKRLRNDTLDDISDTALEAADELERLTAGDVKMPEPLELGRDFDMGWDGVSAWGFTEEQLKDYSDRRAAAAVIAENVRICKLLGDTNYGWVNGMYYDDISDAVRGIL